MSVATRFERLPALRREHIDIGAVLVAAIALRLLLYQDIAVRGDLGYWILDGQYIVEGMRPFFDFVGRSPLYLYGYAAARAAFGPDIWVFRWFTATWWLLAGVGLYGIARQIHSHRAGLVALALTTLTPFTLAFTFYSSSQSLGVALGAAAILVLLRSERWPAYAATGALLALAFLSRRSAVLLGPAVVAWAVVRWRAGDHDWRRLLARVVAVTAAYLLTLVAFYAALAQGDISDTVDLFLIHFVNLFVSTGSGGVPLLSMADQVAQGETARVSNSPPLAPMLDARSRMAMLSTLVGGLPLLAGVGMYLRQASRRWLRPTDRQLILTALGVTGAMAAWASATAGYVHRALFPPTAAALVYVAARAAPVDDRVRRHRGVVLCALAWAFVSVGYFIRPNLLAAYYAMDALPYLGVVSAVAYVEWWDGLDLQWRRGLAVVLAVALLVSAGPLSPLMIGGAQTHERVAYFTADRVDALGTDIDSRIDDGVVLTSQPNYVATADAHAFERNTRALYLAHVFGDSGPMRDYYGRLIDGMESGHIELVVMGVANRQLLSYNQTAYDTFNATYCEAPGQSLYTSLNATLYQQCP